MLTSFVGNAADKAFVSFLVVPLTAENTSEKDSLFFQSVMVLAVFCNAILLSVSNGYITINTLLPAN